MEFFNKIKNSPYAEVLAEVAVLSRIIKIERHTMQEIEAN